MTNNSRHYDGSVSPGKVQRVAGVTDSNSTTPTALEAMLHLVIFSQPYTERLKLLYHVRVCIM